MELIFPPPLLYHYTDLSRKVCKLFFDIFSILFYVLFFFIFLLYHPCPFFSIDPLYDGPEWQYDKFIREHIEY